jgi:hypothetical protein
VKDHSTFVKVRDASKNSIAGDGGVGLAMPNYIRQNDPAGQNQDQEANTGGGTVIGGGRSNYKAFAGNGVRIGGDAI